jgi:hypothetical protein
MQVFGIPQNGASNKSDKIPINKANEITNGFKHNF